MNHPIQYERGFALITSLLLLIGLMLLGVSAMDMSVVDERLAGNTAHRNTTYQLAETALRQAERELDNNPSMEVGSVAWNSTRLQKGASSFGFTSSSDWANARTVVIPGAQSSQTVQYQMEELEEMRASGRLKSRVWRITARATDSTNNSAVVLQSFVMKTRNDSADS